MQRVSMKFKNLSLGILMFCFGLTGCATPVHKSFSKLNIGDDKSTVLETLGSPKHSVREDGKDIWVYRYYKGDTEYKRTLQFDTSKLSYLSEEEVVKDPKELLIENDLESMSQDSK